MPSAQRLVFCKNPSCHNSFTINFNNRRKSCCQSCAITIGNLKRYLKPNLCAVCGQPTQRRSYIYCSIKCQFNNRYNQYISRWKQGLESGGIGLQTHTLSGHVNRYIRDKYHNKCSKCGWNQKHPITGKIPLEINHIDGNAENNSEGNLELLCPNCHSLTPNFRNLNKGNGRKWRLDKAH